MDTRIFPTCARENVKRAQPGKHVPDNEVNRGRRLWVSLAVARILKRFYG
jgi:hypothetical protein